MSPFSHLISSLYGHRVLGWKNFLQSFEGIYHCPLAGFLWHCSGRGRGHSAFILSGWGIWLGSLLSLPSHPGCRIPLYCRVGMGVLVPWRPPPISPWLGAVVPCCCSLHGLIYCHMRVAGSPQPPLKPHWESLHYCAVGIMKTQPPYLASSNTNGQGVGGWDTVQPGKGRNLSSLPARPLLTWVVWDHTGFSVMFGCIVWCLFSESFWLVRLPLFRLFS